LKRNPEGSDGKSNADGKKEQRSEDVLETGPWILWRRSLSLLQSPVFS
jgi:hypothetical protein